MRIPVTVDGRVTIFATVLENWFSKSITNNKVFAGFFFYFLHHCILLLFEYREQQQKIYTKRSCVSALARVPPKPPHQSTRTQTISEHYERPASTF